MRGWTRFALLFAFAFAIASCAAAQTAGEKKGSGVYKKESEQQVWKQFVDKVDYDTERKAGIKYGDIIATNEKSVLLTLGDASLWMAPYSVFRVNSEDVGGKTVSIPELLFGEAYFSGAAGTVAMPGQRIECSGRAYLVVDEEKFSMVTSLDGGQKVLPTGATEYVDVPAATQLELGPAGETGELAEMAPEDLEFYSRQETGKGDIGITIADGAIVIATVPMAEFWSRERVALLQDGPESEAGLAIARGLFQQEKEDVTQENIQVFDKTKGPVQKNFSFSTSVAVSTKDETAAGPELTSMTIGGKKVVSGETIELEFKNLEDLTIQLAGKVKNVKEGTKLYLKVGDDEKLLDGTDIFDYEIKVVQDSFEVPRVMGVMIADKAGESLQEDEFFTRENLVSGKLEVAGSAEAGRNVLNYAVELIARTGDTEETQLGKFQVELNLSEIQRVEVSVDDGIGWENAKGTDNWTYALKPSDGETYKIKARAYDVMEHVSEDQFEGYAFNYSYKTEAEKVREVFDMQMRAFLDEDRTTFMRNTSQDFNSNITDLRDYNELDTSLQNRFTCCDINVQYTVNDVTGDRESGRGSVGFYWTPRSITGGAGTTNYADFNYVLEEGNWLLAEVVDPNTFLRASQIANAINLTLEKTVMDADGFGTCQVTAEVLDIAGSIVADGVEVSFSTNLGSMSPSTEDTANGYVRSTFTAPTTDGTATITVTSGSVSAQATITLNPVQPPLPPDE